MTAPHNSGTPERAGGPERAAAPGGVAVVVAARDESERIAATLRALAEVFPGSPLWLADDGSRDDTARIAACAGARVVGGARAGKGAAMTRATRRLLGELAPGEDPVIVLCDGDLGDCAVNLAPLARTVADGGADLAVAAFARRAGGGFGLLVGFAGRAIRRRCGLRTLAPLSGQRAARASTLAAALPFARGYGMEVAMTIDLALAGARVRELELPLAHRAVGRTPRGFLHRGRQLLDVARACRPRPGGPSR